MVVFEVYVGGIAFRPPERDPPISAGADRIAAFLAAGERMKAKARQIHVLWPQCVIERAQNVGDSSCILYAEPSSIARREEAFQGLVSERPNHAGM